MTREYGFVIFSEGISNNEKIFFAYLIFIGILCNIKIQQY